MKNKKLLIIVAVALSACITRSLGIQAKEKNAIRRAVEFSASSDEISTASYKMLSLGFPERHVMVREVFGVNNLSSFLLTNIIPDISERYRINYDQSKFHKTMQRILSGKSIITYSDLVINRVDEQGLNTKFISVDFNSDGVFWGSAIILLEQDINTWQARKLVIPHRNQQEFENGIVVFEAMNPNY